MCCCASGAVNDYVGVPSIHNKCETLCKVLGLYFIVIVCNSKRNLSAKSLMHHGARVWFYGFMEHDY